MTQNKRAYDLGQQAGRAQVRSVQDREIPAVMGKVRATGAISLRGDAANDDKIAYPYVYVRLYGLDADLRVATCVNVGAEPGLNVMVEKNADNQYRVTRLDDEKAAKAKGQQAGDLASPPNTGSKLDLNNERNLLLGRLRLAQTGTLKVTADPFLYVDTNGVIKVFDPDAIDALDLTSHLPAADGGGNAQQRYVFVTFNPDATTPALVAHEGTEQIFTLSLSAYGYLDIDLTSADGHYPLGPIRVQTGDTTLTETRFNSAEQQARGLPGRLLMGKLGLGGGGGGLPAFGGQETVQISGGVLDISAATGANILVEAETSTTDIVDSVVGLNDGEGAIFQAVSGHTITFAHDAGVLNLDAGTDIDLAGTRLLMLLGRGSGEVTQPVDETNSGGYRAGYSRTTSQSLTATAWNIFNFDTSDYDTGSAITTGASWAFTAPKTGYYLVNAYIRIDLNRLFELAVFVNGSEYSRIGNVPPNASFSVTFGSTVVPLTVGDTLNLRIYNPAGATTPTMPIKNHMTISQL